MYIEKTTNHRKDKIIIALCMAVVSICVGIWLGTQKDLFFCDEVWTYESANSTWKESIFNKTCQWITGEDVSYYLAATEKSLRLSEILENLWTDHVPLYFWIFRVVSKLFFYGSSTVWIGLSINIVLYVILTVWLYFSVDYVLKDRILSAVMAGAFVWTVPLTLEHVTLIRMYLLLFLECAMTLGAFLYLITESITERDNSSLKKDNSRVIRFYIQLFLIVSAGLLTHYYYWPFVLISGFLTAAILLIEKGFCSFFFLSATGAFAAIFVTVLDRAKWIKNLFRDNGQLAVNQLRTSTISLQFNILGVIEKIGDSVCLFGLKWHIKLVLVSFVVLAAILIRKAKRDRNYMYASFFTVLTIFICATVISAANIKDFTRYYWPLMMVWNCLFYISLGVILKEIIERCKQKCNENRKLMDIFSAIIVILFFTLIVGYNIKTIDCGNGLYYLGKAESNDIFLKNNRDIPWIVFSDAFDYDEESLLFDLKYADRLCLIRTSDMVSPSDLKLPENDSFILFCRDEAVDEAMDYINASGNSRYTCNRIKEYHNTVFSFYWITSGAP